MNIQYQRVILLFVACTKLIGRWDEHRDEHRDEHYDQKRVYDRTHKDYHTGDDNENCYYHQYNDENHRQYRDYSKLKRGDQDNYWKWRHEHGDDNH